VSAPSEGSFRQLTRNPWEDDFPTWSPDGRSIAFYSFRPQGAGIYVMDASGRHQRLLAATTDPTSWAPAWAPDGKSIAFVRGVASKAEIYTIRPDGRGLRRLTSNSVFDTDPSWSPDGRRIAFASDRNGRSEIYVMSAGRCSGLPTHSSPSLSGEAGRSSGSFPCGTRAGCRSASRTGSSPSCCSVRCSSRRPDEASPARTGGRSPAPLFAAPSDWPRSTSP